MPLTPKGEEIKSAMQKEYGPAKGEKVLYASANKGTISGIHDQGSGPAPTPPAPAMTSAPVPTPPAPAPEARDMGMVTAPNAALPLAGRRSGGFTGGGDRGVFGSQSFNGAFKGRSV